MTAIAIDGLGFAYHGSPVLTGVTLAVNPGEIYGLVGADGAGKTTLLQLAVGQLPPQAGRITVLDRDDADPALRDEIAYMPQGFGLYRDLSVQENLYFLADLHRLTPVVACERIVELLERTGLAGFSVCWICPLPWRCGCLKCRYAAPCQCCCYYPCYS